MRACSQVKAIRENKKGEKKRTGKENSFSPLCWSFLHVSPFLWSVCLCLLSESSGSCFLHFPQSFSCGHWGERFWWAYWIPRGPTHGCFPPGFPSSVGPMPPVLQVPTAVSSPGPFPQAPQAPLLPSLDVVCSFLASVGFPLYWDVRAGGPAGLVQSGMCPQTPSCWYAVSGSVFLK